MDTSKTNYPANKNIYLTILLSVQNENKLPACDSKQRLNYYVRKLKADGIIRKIGYGTWEALKKELPQEVKKEVKILPRGTSHRVKNIFTFQRKLRGHGFIISFQIPKLPNWHKRHEYLERINQPYKKLYPNNQSILFREHKVWLCSKRIVIYSPKSKSYFSTSAHEAQKYALYDLLELLKGIENMLNCSFKVGGKYRFKVSRQHYGKINDELANFYDRNNERLAIANEKGVWAIADGSMRFMPNELETIDKDTAAKDMDYVIVPFYNDLKAHYDKTGESLKVSDVLGLVNGVAQNQKEYAENIKSHIEAIRKLGDGVEKLTELVGRHKQ